MNKAALKVENLHTDFRMRDRTVHAVNGVSYEIHPGEIIGIVGESGCGKSVTQMSIMQLIPSPPGYITGGEALFDGKNLLGYSADDKYIRNIRGGKISMIFQDPMTSLNPVMKVGDQIAESIQLHMNLNKKEARSRAMELMKSVRISDPEQRYNCYPHEFSGGMCQRIMIAMAMSCNPDILIADEATTALDVTIQAQILEMLRDIVKETNTSLIIVTHNLGIVARYAERIYVMYAGQVIESGSSLDIFQNPGHAYTIGLLNSVPRLDDDKDRMLMPIEGSPPNLHVIPQGCPFIDRCTQSLDDCRQLQEIPHREISSGHYTSCINKNLDRKIIKGKQTEKNRSESGKELLIVKKLRKSFNVTQGIIIKKTIGKVHAVNDVSFVLRQGETMGLVGESGCGKTTLARCIMNLSRPDSGEILFDNANLSQFNKKQIRSSRKQIQMIFQDPFGSLDPRFSIGQIVGEPLKIHKLVKDEANYKKRISELFEMVGLSPYLQNRSPHELSGGQRQRIGIARALASDPELIICDEPVSALDVSVQAQILNLLEKLQRDLNLTYLFIAHDLSVVRHISDRVTVMYLGQVVEIGSWKSLYDDPKHPYTKVLLSAVPIPDPLIEKSRSLEQINGDVPSAAHIPEGCQFHPRCPYKTERCLKETPALHKIETDHAVACFLHE